MLGALVTPATYRAASYLAAPIVPFLLARRTRRGKEDETRRGERLGHASLARPDGPLVWLHAASVGESLSILPLVGRLMAGRPELTVLVTSGTTTSARLLAERLPAGALHQFVPVDRTDAVRRFLDHWQPDLALWVESELWPNLVLETAHRGVPMALVNARMSGRSAERWSRLPRLAGPLLGAFSRVLAQSDVDATRFRALGGRAVSTPGNLKFDAPPPDADNDVVHALRQQIGERPHWLAASTHPGEERIVADAHLALAQDHNGLLTILCPRHPERGDAIAEELAELGFTVARRSRAEPIAAETDVYLADTLGEMGLLYRLARVVFIGGSLRPHAGHNPVEAAQLGCALITGPDMRNFANAAAALGSAGGLVTVHDAATLADAIGAWLADSDALRCAGAAAQDAAAGLGGALDITLDTLAPLLPPQTGGHEANNARA